MKKQPLWLLVVAGLFTLAPLFFSIMGYLKPSLQFPGLDPAALSLAGTLGLYLSRNLATGVLMGIALLKREPGLLAGAFVMRLGTDVFDFMNFIITRQNPQSGILALVFIAVATPAAISFWKGMDKGS